MSYLLEGIVVGFQVKLLASLLQNVGNICVWYNFYGDSPESCIYDNNMRSHG